MRLKSPPRPPVFATGCAAAALAAALAAGGCSDLVRASRLEPAGVNVESPAAAAVLAAQSRRTPYPSFRDVPPKVADIRPAAGYRSAVASLNAERSGFRNWEAQNPLETSDTQGFADATRGGLQGASPAAPPADQSQLSADWAKRARDAAKAPAGPPAASKP